MNHNHVCSECGRQHPHDVPVAECQWPTPWLCPGCEVGDPVTLTPRDLDMLLNAVEWLQENGGLADVRPPEYQKSNFFTSADYAELNRKLRDAGAIY